MKMKKEITKNTIGGFLWILCLLSFPVFSCVGHKIEKKFETIESNHFIDQSNIGSIDKTDKIGFLMASYDFILQINQPFFIDEENVLEYVFLDYHQSKGHIIFDKKIREKFQFFLSNNFTFIFIDIKDNITFQSYVKKNKRLTVKELLSWLKKNSDLKKIIIFYYSIGEKGEVQAENVIPMIIPIGPYIMYSARWDSEMVKYSAFTYQSSIFDINSGHCQIKYNFTKFVKPNSAVDSFYTKSSDFSKNSKSFIDVLSILFKQ